MPWNQIQCFFFVRQLYGGRKEANVKRALNCFYQSTGRKKNVDQEEGPLKVLTTSTVSWRKIAGLFIYNIFPASFWPVFFPALANHFCFCRLSALLTMIYPVINSINMNTLYIQLHDLSNTSVQCVLSESTNKTANMCNFYLTASLA